MHTSRYWTRLITGIVLVGLVASCGSAPITLPAMEKYQGAGYTVESPQAWQKHSADMLGMALTYFSPGDINTQDAQQFNFEEMVSQDPVVILMVIPAALAQASFDDIDQVFDEMNPTKDEPGVKVIKQENTTMGGAKGKLLIAQGADVKAGKIGLHMVVAKNDAGTVVVMMGITPDKEMDKNLRIFEHMQSTFTFVK